MDGVISLLFLFAALSIFWVGIFVFTTNPFNKLSRLGSLLLIVLACFNIVGYLLYSTSSYKDYAVIYRYFGFPLIFIPVIWFHIAVLITKARISKFWVSLIFLGYILGIASYLIDATTFLVFDYNKLIAPVSRSHFIFAPGPLFYLALIHMFVFFSLAFFIFVKRYFEVRRTPEKLKLLFPFLISLIFMLGFLTIIASSVFITNVYVRETGEDIIALGAILLVINVVLNRLFLEEAKSNLYKEFIYSTITSFSIILTYTVVLIIFHVKAAGLNVVFIPLFLLLLLLTHSIYDWVMSFVRNVFQGEISLPRVTDEEVGIALRNLRRPDRLEESTLLRLKLAKESTKPNLDRLKEIVITSIEYFRPEEENRTRATLKYNILKLIGNQVEEGQILWDLGFEEYPLEIAEKANRQKPRFAIASPTDYQAISRNAFISLKKEAIHDLAWRISYLEKHHK